MLSRAFACAVVVAALFVSPVHATQAAPLSEAGAYVESLGSKVVAIISNNKLPQDKKKKQIEQIFRENVDIAWVGRFVLGRYWRPLSEEQKAHYLKEYENFLVYNYATRFTEYTSGTFKVTDTRQDEEGEYTVSMQISAGESNAQPVLVDYRVRRNAKGGKAPFLVFDVIIEGVSMITTQRSEFGSVMNDKGIDHLITQLTNKSIAVPTKPEGKAEAKK
jgi:phospholipid transport system substrate-binding protein